MISGFRPGRRCGPCVNETCADTASFPCFLQALQPPCSTKTPIAGFDTRLYRKTRGRESTNQCARKQALTSLPQIPTATYRLQLNRDFTFRDAAALVPYLSSLGISHVYVSPYLRARPGSMHGYDIIDHNTLNPEIGTPEEYEDFVAQLHRHGMGQILDIVPNHMGVMGSDNAWWLDVLENGEASEYAEYFDIDWDPIKDELQGKVLIPVLADQYGNELERGKLKLTFDSERGEFSIFYYQHRFPVDPAEYPRILGFQVESLQKQLDSTHQDFLELQSIVTAFSHLPQRRGLSPEQRAERNREKEVQKRRLATLCARASEIRDFLNSNVKAFNGNAEDPHSFDNLHELIKAQAYRLAQWRVAADDINYRRFFDINDLAALRMENDAVFENTHRFILDLVAKGKVDGLRIDHPDGLYDPTNYFRQLQEKLSVALAGQNRRTYVIAEKILTGQERLRKAWPIEGTTGHEFANLVNGLFVDRTACEKMGRIYRAFCGRSPDFEDLVYTCKKLILKVALASELNVLANLLSRIALANRHTCDFTLNSLRSALSEVIACFPVYRTYVGGREVSSEDRRYVEQAVTEGRKRSTAADLSVFDFVRRVLLVDIPSGEPEWYARATLRFAMKFQQVTAAVMAKGVEDTAFYRYNRLISLNEVGGDPTKFGITLEEFHRANLERVHCWPNSMLSTSTHDSKESEDVRARINVLSEIPAAWRLRLRRWREWNENKKRVVDGQSAPTRDDEYRLYQTLVGMWPSLPLDDAGWSKFSERIEHCMLKAAREAKAHTSWANTNFAYEGAFSAFVRALLNRAGKNPFLEDFAEFHRRIARAGMFNSLSQCLLKLTSPGVPDIYQGNETWQFSLVDPDNRRLVDYPERARLLEELCSTSQSQQLPNPLKQILHNDDEGKAKLYLTWKTLGVRKTETALFQQGTYIPLTVTGGRSEHVIAFAREHEGRTAIVAAPRLCAALLGQDRDTICDEALWGDTYVEIAGADRACYHNVFTGECIPTSENKTLQIGKLFRHFPVALLISEPSGPNGDCVRPEEPESLL
jgi:(1->4)-alpha-D-glucan 1-alpha-D-glucosylmutase